MISDFSKDTNRINLVDSEVEAKRFKISVARLNVPVGYLANDDEIVEVCSNAIAKLLIIRYPSTRSRLSQQLVVKTGRIVFQADALVYFYKYLNSDIREKLVDGPWIFRYGDASDKSKIETLSKIIFEDYPNHYSANSWLETEDIRDGYAEWAQVGLNDSAKLTVIIEDNKAKQIGFALISFDGDTAEIELNGIHPQAQGRGAYGSLLSWLSTHLATRGVKKLCISTQIQNERVIRAWIRAGFNLEFSLNTIHLMKP